jgi:hypothetical protein
LDRAAGRAAALDVGMLGPTSIRRDELELGGGMEIFVGRGWDVPIGRRTP